MVDLSVNVSLTGWGSPAFTKPKEHYSMRNRIVTLTAAAILAMAPVIIAGPAEAAAPAYVLHYFDLGNKFPVRWNPCRLHTYKVNIAVVPRAAQGALLAEAQASMRYLSAKSGIAWIYKGTTGEVPQQESASKQSADIIIAYTTAAKTNYSLKGGSIALGGWSSGGQHVYLIGKGMTSNEGIVKGFVVLDTPKLLKMLPGHGTGARRGNVMIHELGHAFGLDHVNNPSLLMSGAMSKRTPNGFAPAELGAFTKIGRKAGCIKGI